MDTRLTLIFLMCLSCFGIVIGALLTFYNPEGDTTISRGIFLTSTIFFGLCLGGYVRICMVEDRQRIIDIVLSDDV